VRPGRRARVLTGGGCREGEGVRERAAAVGVNGAQEEVRRDALFGVGLRGYRGGALGGRRGDVARGFGGVVRGWGDVEVRAGGAVVVAACAGCAGGTAALDGGGRVSLQSGVCHIWVVDSYQRHREIIHTMVGRDR
jgi:hypothetical protein